MFTSIYLKGRVIERRQRESEKERESSSMHGFTPKMPSTAKAGSGHSWKPVAPSESFTWVARNQILEPCLLFPRRYISGKLNWKQTSQKLK